MIGRSVHHERTVSATTFITLDKILKYKNYCYKFRLRIHHLKNILFISEPANLKRGGTKRRKSVSGRRVSNILFKFYISNLLLNHQKVWLKNNLRKKKRSAKFAKMRLFSLVILSSLQRVQRAHDEAPLWCPCLGTTIKWTFMYSMLQERGLVRKNKECMIQPCCTATVHYLIVTLSRSIVIQLKGYILTRMWIINMWIIHGEKKSRLMIRYFLFHFCQSIH